MPIERHRVYDTTQLHLEGLAIGVGNFEGGRDATVGLWLLDERRSEESFVRAQESDQFTAAGYRIHVVAIDREDGEYYVELDVVPPE